MAEPIEQWLKHLDAILEQHSFETAEEAEAWLRLQSENRSIDEFFETCAVPTVRLMSLWQRAENAQDPEKALALYEQAIADAEETLPQEIAAARREPLMWQEGKMQPYLCSMFGRAATKEMLGDLAGAEQAYLQVWEADPLDSLGTVEKLFSLSLTDGRLADARAWLDRLAEEDSTIVLYHRALLRFLEAADHAEQAYHQNGDLAAASSWQDEMANELLSRALRRNPYVASLMAHPRAFELSCPSQAAIGSPAEAVLVMYATAHLWLSDFLALSWLIGQAKAFAGDATTFRDDWHQLLQELGGEPSDEERYAYLRQLEEMDG
jgi:tetratricopeptide (TPR) repeat protein